MQANEHRHESAQHSQVSIGHVRAHIVNVAFRDSPIDNEAWEEPKSHVDPRNKHGSISHSLDHQWSDINSQLEECHSQISQVVKNHDSTANWEHVEGIGEEDKGPGHQVMKHILGEIWSSALLKNGVSKFI